MASSQGRRRWYQYSLRTLLIMVLLASVGLSWLAVKMHQAREQREAAEATRKLGGRVWYSYEYRDGTTYFAPNNVPSQSAWLRGMLGGDFFDDVTGVVFSESTSLADADLRHLEGMRHLELLNINRGNGITDAGLKHLEGLGGLRILRLSQAPITDAGLKHLDRLGSLRELCLSETQITGPGLKHLKALSQLTRLDLTESPIVDSGLAHIKGLSQLQDLTIRNTRITDAGLENLQGLSQLVALEIVGDQITGTGLKYLQGLPSLRVLRLFWTLHSHEDVKAFEKACPNCHLIYLTPGD